MVSICEECVQELVLKKYIRERNYHKGLCDTCGAEDAFQIDFEEDKVIDQAIRSLIRCRYDEWDYNHHWGGESIEKIFWRDRIIFTEGFYKNEDVADMVISSTFHEAYYDSNKGVSTFYGYADDGQQYYFYWSLNHAEHGVLNTIIGYINAKDYLMAISYTETLIRDCAQYLTKDVSNLDLFRARLGCSETGFHEDDYYRMINTIRYLPYAGNEISSPPSHLARKGRMNREGFSFLYLAENIKTAVSEIRPSPGDVISIGKFRQNQLIKILDLSDIDISKFWFNNDLLTIYFELYALGRFVSKQTGSDGDHMYIFTQLMAEELLRKGYGGIKFNSSFTGEPNYTIFSPNYFDFDVAGSSILKVKSINVECEPGEILDPKKSYKND